MRDPGFAAGIVWICCLYAFWIRYCTIDVRCITGESRFKVGQQAAFRPHVLSLGHGLARTEATRELIARANGLRSRRLFVYGVKLTAVKQASKDDLRGPCLVYLPMLTRPKNIGTVLPGLYSESDIIFGLSYDVSSQDGMELRYRYC